MALAIKSFTARRAYRGITQHFLDRGRVLKTVFCPTRRIEYVLYYRQRTAEADTSIRLETELRRICPTHTGWLSWEETPPFTVEERSMQRAQILENIGLTAVVSLAQGLGSKPVRTAFRSPWQNGIAERWVGSCRRDLLDHVIVLHERHLKRLLREYLRYYHEDRTHLGLAKDTPQGRPIAVTLRQGGRIQSAPRIGGLHHRYTVAA